MKQDRPSKSEQTENIIVVPYDRNRKTRLNKSQKLIVRGCYLLSGILTLIWPCASALLAKSMGSPNTDHFGQMFLLMLLLSGIYLIGAIVTIWAASGFLLAFTGLLARKKNCPRSTMHSLSSMPSFHCILA